MKSADIVHHQAAGWGSPGLAREQQSRRSPAPSTVPIQSTHLDAEGGRRSALRSARNCPEVILERRAQPITLAAAGDRSGQTTRASRARPRASSVEKSRALPLITVVRERTDALEALPYAHST
jgi:hypothetical protein